MKVIRLLSEKGARTYRFMKIVSRSAVVILSEARRLSEGSLFQAREMLPLRWRSGLRLTRLSMTNPRGVDLGVRDAGARITVAARRHFVQQLLGGGDLAGDVELAK